MDFTKCGALHIKGAEEAAQEDLESLRAAASGMGREDGFAAMKVEADELKAGKPPKEVGFIERDGNAFRAHVHFRERGAERNIYGPLRLPLLAATAQGYLALPLPAYAAHAHGNGCHLDR